MDNKEILVFAHRGASKEFPENTMPAFKRAAELNADFIETDIHLTKDGRFIVIHDDVIDRVTNGTGRVADYTMDELKRFDAGYNFTINGNEYPYRGKGICLSSLEEMLDEFPGQSFNIDLKDKNPDQVKLFSDIIKKYNASERVIAASEHYPNLKALRKFCPDIRTSFSVREVAWLYFLHRSGLFFIKKKFNGIAFQIPEKWGRFKLATRAFIDEVHKKGLQVHVWTVNDRADMKRLAGLGVDGIMTDDPALLVEVLRDNRQ